jgi:hypothetical protein
VVNLAAEGEIAISAGACGARVTSMHASRARAAQLLGRARALPGIAPSYHDARAALVSRRPEAGTIPGILPTTIATSPWRMDLRYAWRRSSQHIPRTGT